MKIEDLAYEIDSKEVLKIKEELVTLYYRELFEKEIYLKQILKLEGDIIEILKRISIQEEKHANLLMSLLGRANIRVKEYLPKIPSSKINAPLAVAIEYDVEQEEISSTKYVETIDKTKNKEMKAFLQFILYEEYEHIQILRSFLEKEIREGNA